MVKTYHPEKLVIKSIGGWERTSHNVLLEARVHVLTPAIKKWRDVLAGKLVLGRALGKCSLCTAYMVDHKVPRCKNCPLFKAGWPCFWDAPWETLYEGLYRHIFTRLGGIERNTLSELHQFKGLDPHIYISIKALCEKMLERLQFLQKQALENLDFATGYQFIERSETDE